MRSADAYNGNQFDEFLLQRNRVIHRQRLREGVAAQVDKGRPDSFRKNACVHRMDTVKIKDEWNARNLENKILVEKMRKINKFGSASTGGPPPRPPKKKS